jgi:hypothetical protein
MTTVTKKQAIVLSVMAAFAAVMFAGPIAMNSSFAWSGDDDGFFHHHHHHFFFFHHHHHHHFFF